ncbi:MAG: hypothetical protein WCO44_12860 [Bacteroidota bacterium]
MKDKKTGNAKGGDGSMENPKNIEPEKIPGENIPATRLETKSTNQETENMEVHHHPQLHHQPKPWKEYFLEFVMIFLAVTLGFFAENIRDNFAGAEKAKEYARSLYDDLKIDTAIIQRTCIEKKWLLAKFDTVGKILESGDLTNSEFIYYVERYINFNDVFISQDITYQQLRNSGNFRYIKKIALYKKIADYYSLYSRYQAVDGNFGFVGKDDMSELESKLFDPKDLTNLDNEKASNFYNLVNRPNGKLKPISNDQQNLRLLYIKFANASNRTYGAILFLGWLKAKATVLINDIKKEYSFD